MKTAVHTTDNLRMRIAELELLAKEQEYDLKASAKDVAEALKPVNLLRGAFRSTVKTPGLGKNLVKGAVGLAAGFLSKKIFVMGSSNIVKKALGTIVELGVAKVVANNANKITAGGLKILNRVRK